MGNCFLPSTISVAPPVPDPVFSLIFRAKKGDHGAFTELYNLHRRKVHSLCLRMTGDVMEAEDLSQDAFIQVLLSLHSFQGKSSFSTWLHRVVVNTVMMKRRRGRPPHVTLDEPVRAGSTIAERHLLQDDLNLLGSIDRIALRRALVHLPRGRRRIFLLYEVEGYAHHEIARLLCCSVGNSKSQLHQARRQIRELLLVDTRMRTRSRSGPPSPVPSKADTSRRFASIKQNPVIASQFELTLKLRASAA